MGYRIKPCICHCRSRSGFVLKLACSFIGCRTQFKRRRQPYFSVTGISAYESKSLGQLYIRIQKKYDSGLIIKRNNLAGGRRCHFCRKYREVEKSTTNRRRYNCMGCRDRDLHQCFYGLALFQRPQTRPQYQRGILAYGCRYVSLHRSPFLRNNHTTHPLVYNRSDHRDNCRLCHFNLYMESAA